MIKIIQVSSDTNIGGAGKCLLTILKNYDKRRFIMKVILPENSLLKPEVEKTDTEVFEVPGIADKSLDFGAVSELKRIFKSEKPDIVHAHASMSARIAARQAGCKVVYTRHSVFEPPRKISRGIGKLINGMVNNYYADEIIAVAEAAKDNLTATGVNEKKITVVLNGVDGLESANAAEREQLKTRFGVKDEKVISIVARLEDIKGHVYFIEAAKSIVEKGLNAKFFIAGTGSYEAALKSKANELGLGDKLVFTGFLKDVECLIKITDIQVNASYGTEATSLALLEGMSIGIPAVVSDFGGNPGVIKNGINGFIVPKQNSKALAEGIEKLICDEQLYKSQHDAALRIFKKEFTSKAMTENTEAIYMKGMI